MNALRLIWETSLVLASAAILVMMMLIVARVITARRAIRRSAERRQLTPLLLRAGDHEAEAMPRIASDVVTDLSLELIQLVRGDERAAFIANATELGIPARLERRLRSGSHRDRADAVHGLAQFDDQTTRDALYRSLDDPDKNIRLASALALAATDEVLDIDSLVEKLELGAGQSSLMTVSLFRRIAESQPEQIKALVVHPGQNAEVRLAAIEALAGTGDYSLVPVIAQLAMAAAEDTEELPRYLHALGRLGHPAARPAVLAGLSSTAMSARAAAAGAAGRIMLVESAGRLAELLGDPEWWVRFRAAESLILLGEPGLALLRAAAAGDQGLARDAATAMLAERGLPA